MEEKFMFRFLENVYWSDNGTIRTGSIIGILKQKNRITVLVGQLRGREGKEMTRTSYAPSSTGEGYTKMSGATLYKEYAEVKEVAMLDLKMRKEMLEKELVRIDGMMKDLAYYQFKEKDDENYFVKAG